MIVNKILQIFSVLMIFVSGSGYTLQITSSANASGENSEVVEKRTMEEKRINVNGVELQVRDYAGNDNVVIFLHYGGGNIMMRQRMLPYFTNDYRLI